MALEIEIRYARPPIRSRECCADPAPTESIPYYRVIDTDPVIDPPVEPEPEDIILMLRTTNTESYANPGDYWIIYGVTPGMTLVKIGEQLCAEGDGDFDYTAPLNATEGHDSFIGYGAGFIRADGLTEEGGAASALTPWPAQDQGCLSTHGVFPGEIGDVTILFLFSDYPTPIDSKDALFTVWIPHGD